MLPNVSLSVGPHQMFMCEYFTVGVATARKWALHPYAFHPLKTVRHSALLVDGLGCTGWRERLRWSCLWLSWGAGSGISLGEAELMPVRGLAHPAAKCPHQKSASYGTGILLRKYRRTITHLAHTTGGQTFSSSKPTGHDSFERRQCNLFTIFTVR